MEGSPEEGHVVGACDEGDAPVAVLVSVMVQRPLEVRLAGKLKPELQLSRGTIWGLTIHIIDFRYLETQIFYNKVLNSVNTRRLLTLKVR